MSADTDLITSALKAAYPNQHSRMRQDPAVRDSKDHLGPGEIPEAVLLGKRQHVFGSTKRGALWATNQRLLWVLPAGLLSASTAESYDYDKITAVSFVPFLWGQLNIDFSGLRELNIWYIDKKAGKTFAAFIRRHLAGVSDSEHPQRTQSPSKEDLTSKLERLANLRDQGAISNAEFKAAKKELLGL